MEIKEADQVEWATYYLDESLGIVIGLYSIVFHPNNAIMRLSNTIEIWLPDEKANDAHSVRARKHLARDVGRIAREKFDGDKVLVIDELPDGRKIGDGEGICVSWEPQKYKDLKSYLTGRDIANLAEPFAVVALEIIK